ncbi:hypothetical protein [Salmonella enterica]|uniref:hypothetical protein n=1 Tax=Salmonella enterica TaxID=28901 RepID=UPI000C226423|nr:hypothetical protein [Salmonella enterica]PJH64275.1 hypothetical protein CVR98_25525 [Salmonella enterica subsp. enterica serovar Enteritidis]
MWFKQLILFKWNPLLLTLVTFWLSFEMFRNNLVILGIVGFALAVAKLHAVLASKPKWKQASLVGINMFWAGTLVLMLWEHDLLMVESAYVLPSVVILLGIGISIQERFNE